MRNIDVSCTSKLRFFDCKSLTYILLRLVTDLLQDKVHPLKNDLGFLRHHIPKKQKKK